MAGTGFGSRGKRNVKNARGEDRLRTSVLLGDQAKTKGKRDR